MSGDVECFQGGHLGVALLAIVVLLICILLIPVTFLITSKAVKVSFLHRATLVDKNY